MSQDADKAQSKPKGRRLWLTVSEVVAVLGLGLAALNYWEGHRDHEETLRREAAKAEAKPEVRSVFLMRGEAENNGERIVLEPVNAAQVVQTQRYVFPTDVLDRAKEIGAGRLQIDLGLFEGGLERALKAARKSGAPLPKGEAILPVGVITTYIENGETRTDQSLYRIGYTAEPGLLGAVKLQLLGATVARRGVTGDVQAAVDAAWRAQVPKATQ